MELQRREFAVGKCLGRGGFGEVYRATMRSPGGLSRDVAVKVLRPDLDPDGQALERLRDEGRLLARLDHPAILGVHDLTWLEGRVALVTEFVDGEDLATCITGADPLPLRALLEVIAAVAGALQAAFDAPAPGGGKLGLVHRDIKPSNIRITRHGGVKLLDFGIARSDAVGREARTKTDLVVGSPGYLAPERFLEPDAHPAADVFALGCALFEGIVHRPLYDDVSVLMMSAQALDPTRFSTYQRDRVALLPRDLPRPLRTLLVSMLAREPDERPTAAQVQAACEDLAEKIGGNGLVRWARARAWVDPPDARGPLAGRVITEGTLARPRPGTSLAKTIPAEDWPEPGGPSAEFLGKSPPTLSGGQPSISGSRPLARSAWLGVGVLGFGALFAAGALVLAAGVGGAWWLGAGARPDVAVGEVLAGDAAAEAAEPSDTDAEPAAKGRDDAPATTRRTEGRTTSANTAADAAKGPNPRSAPAEPSHGPTASGSDTNASTTDTTAPPKAPEVRVSREAEGQVVGEGPIAIRLLRDGAVYPPGAMPAGEYAVEAQFDGATWTLVTRVTVSPGQTLKIVCAARMANCRVE